MNERVNILPAKFLPRLSGPEGPSACARAGQQPLNGSTAYSAEGSNSASHKHKYFHMIQLFQALFKDCTPSFWKLRPIHAHHQSWRQPPEQDRFTQSVHILNCFNPLSLFPAVLCLLSAAVRGAPSTCLLLPYHLKTDTTMGMGVTTTVLGSYGERALGLDTMRECLMQKEGLTFTQRSQVLPETAV
eukprot:scaffold225700_cov21-Tisochrysis_lutea.AAC.1